MFCTNCGTRLPDGAKFCFNCGAKVFDDNMSSYDEIKDPEIDDNANVKAEAKPIQYHSLETYQQDKRKENLQNMAKVAAIICIVAAAGYGLFSLFEYFSNIIFYIDYYYYDITRQMIMLTGLLVTYLACYLIILSILLKNESSKKIMLAGTIVLCVSEVIWFGWLGSGYATVIQTIGGLMKITAAGYLIGLAVTKEENIMKKLWFIPGALVFLSWILKIIGFQGYYGYGMIILNMLFTTAIYLACSFYLVFEQYIKRSTDEYNQNGERLFESAYIDMAKHVLLLIFTCGIWTLVWVYRTTEYLNRVKIFPDAKPLNKMLLYGFVPFYNIYWSYQNAKKIDEFARINNCRSNIMGACIACAILVPIVSPIIMQMKLNEIIQLKMRTVNNGMN